MEARGSTAINRLRRGIRAGGEGSLRGTGLGRRVGMTGGGLTRRHARCAHRANDRGRFVLGDGRSLCGSFDDCGVPCCCCADVVVCLTMGTPRCKGFVFAITRGDANLH